EARVGDGQSALITPQFDGGAVVVAGADVDELAADDGETAEIRRSARSIAVADPDAPRRDVREHGILDAQSVERDAVLDVDAAHGAGEIDAVERDGAFGGEFAAQRQR